MFPTADYMLVTTAYLTKSNGVLSHSEQRRTILDRSFAAALLLARNQRYKLLSGKQPTQSSTSTESRGP